MSRFLSILALSVVVLVPPSVRADDHRYYDREHKDYHEWNEQEEQAYKRFLQEKHREYHEWSKASRREQQEYWNWRHEHHD
jgi:hypothetical protein